MILQSQLNKLAGFETDSYIILNVSIDKNNNNQFYDLYIVYYDKSANKTLDYRISLNIKAYKKDIRIMSYGQLKFVDNSCINAYNNIIMHLSNCKFVDNSCINVYSNIIMQLSNCKFEDDSLVIVAINTKTGLLSLEDCNNKKPNWLISLTNEENIRDLDNYKI